MSSVEARAHSGASLEAAIFSCYGQREEQVCKYHIVLGTEARREANRTTKVTMFVDRANLYKA